MVLSPRGGKLLMTVQRRRNYANYLSTTRRRNTSRAYCQVYLDTHRQQ